MANNINNNINYNIIPMPFSGRIAYTTYNIALYNSREHEYDTITVVIINYSDVTAAE